LRAATDHLAARGSDNPRLDAELLLCRALRCQRIDLYVAHDRPVGEAELGEFRAFVGRRAGGEPVAYILGEREFHGLSFFVDRRVLVPRPETEHLVDEALSVLEGIKCPRVADVGTGSGCIAISIAKEIPTAEVFAVDVRAEALEVARANRERLVPDAHIRFFEGDLCAPLAGHGPFDAIVSNPPYVSTGEMASLPRDVRAFEPASALHCGDDPVAVHRRLIEQGLPLLSANGALLMEVGSDGARRLGGDVVSRTIPDLSGTQRVVVVTP
jgi:release factor glutamine methyltransferase